MIIFDYLSSFTKYYNTNTSFLYKYRDYWFEFDVHTPKIKNTLPKEKYIEYNYSEYCDENNCLVIMEKSESKYWHDKHIEKLFDWREVQKALEKQYPELML